MLGTNLFNIMLKKLLLSLVLKSISLRLQPHYNCEPSPSIISSPGGVVRAGRRRRTDKRMNRSKFLCLIFDVQRGGVGGDKISNIRESCSWHKNVTQDYWVLGAEGYLWNTWVNPQKIYNQVPSGWCLRPAAHLNNCSPFIMQHNS